MNENNNSKNPDTKVLTKKENTLSPLPIPTENVSDKPQDNFSLLINSDSYKLYSGVFSNVISDRESTTISKEIRHGIPCLDIEDENIRIWLSLLDNNQILLYTETSAMFDKYLQELSERSFKQIDESEALDISSKLIHRLGISNVDEPLRVSAKTYQWGDKILNNWHILYQFHANGYKTLDSAVIIDLYADGKILGIENGYFKEPDSLSINIHPEEAEKLGEDYYNKYYNESPEINVIKLMPEPSIVYMYSWQDLEGNIIPKEGKGITARLVHEVIINPGIGFIPIFIDAENGFMVNCGASFPKF